MPNFAVRGSYKLSSKKKKCNNIQIWRTIFFSFKICQILHHEDHKNYLTKKLQQCLNMDNYFPRNFKVCQILHHEDHTNYHQKKKLQQCLNMENNFLMSFKICQILHHEYHTNYLKKKKIATVFKYAEQFSYDLQNMSNFAPWGHYKLGIFKKNCNNVPI